MFLLPCRSRRTQVPKLRAQIYNAEDRDHALRAVKTFEADYGAKWPKAVAKITERIDVLLAFYDYPAEHWIHLRTTNPIESTFATVRLRQPITKGPGSRAAGVATAFKLMADIPSRRRGWPTTAWRWCSDAGPPPAQLDSGRLSNDQRPVLDTVASRRHR
jgi:transposase-like protein